jgi:hypothetical protein
MRNKIFWRLVIIMMISGLVFLACDILTSGSADSGGITDGGGIVDDGDEEKSGDDGITDGGEEEEEKEEEEEGNTTKFEGTWMWKNSFTGVQVVYKFTGNTFEFTSDDTEETNYPKGPIFGTFTFTDTTITFTTSGESPKTWTMEYDDNILSLPNSQEDSPPGFGGTLRKQGGGGGTNTTKFEGTWKTQVYMNDYYIIIIFTGSNFEYFNNNSKETLLGTFEFTDTTITFTLADNLKTWTMDYNDKVLDLSNPQGNNPTRFITGLFRRQQ